MKKVLVLGCTGSVGASTLDILTGRKEDFKLVGLQAHRNEKALLEAAGSRSDVLLCLSGLAPTDSRINFQGPRGILDLIDRSDADIVVNGIVGASGLEPTLRAIENGMDVALANKESMVLAGGLIKERAAAEGITLLPVDSEHSALFQLLHNRKFSQVDELILTASGGPFRNLPLEEFPRITLQDALKHPTWEMGQKITIDSATMANKGLEVIEAQQLFDFPVGKIKVLIHPQSYVHSLIRTADMALYAQISDPDMRLPIQDALYYPEMKEVAWTYLDLAGRELTFEAPDFRKFPMLQLAFRCGEEGGGYPIAYNGANEIAVAAFLEERISFMDIPRITEKTLEKGWSSSPRDLEEILNTDEQARETARSFLKGLSS